MKIATTARAYHGPNDELVIAAITSLGETISTAIVRTPEDVARFLASNPGVTMVDHAPMGAAVPQIVQSSYPTLYPKAKYYEYKDAVVPFPDGFPNKVVIGGIGALGTGAACVPSIQNLGLQAIVILRDGSIHQIGKLDSFGKTLAGMCVNIVPECSGHVVLVDGEYRNYYTNAPVSTEETRVRHGKTYHVYSDAQEKAILNLCLWLAQSSRGLLTVDDFLGLDEVAGLDAPSGSMRNSMEDFRKILTAIGVKT